MSTKKTKTEQAPSRHQKAEKRAATLPTEAVELLAVARAAREGFNAAVIDADDAQAAKAVELIEAVIWKLNDGTFFACSAHEDSARTSLRAIAQQHPGRSPAGVNKANFS